MTHPGVEWKGDNKIVIMLSITILLLLVNTATPLVSDDNKEEMNKWTPDKQTIDDDNDYYSFEIPAVYKYSLEGDLLWIMETASEGIEVDEENNLYFKYGNIIEKTDEKGNLLYQIKVQEECVRQTHNILFVRNEGILVQCEKLENKGYRELFIAYDQNGKHSWTIESEKVANRELINKTINHKGEYIIIIRGNNKYITKISRNGKEVWKKDNIKIGNLRSIDYLECDGNDNIVLVGLMGHLDNAHYRVIKYDDDGNEIWRIKIPLAGEIYGKKKKDGWIDLKNIAFGKDGKIFLIDGFALYIIEKNGLFKTVEYEEMTSTPTLATDNEGNLILFSGSSIGYGKVIIVRKLNDKGEEIWEHSYQPEEWVGNDYEQLLFKGADIGKDGTIALGMVISEILGKRETIHKSYVIFMYLDSEGKILWERSWERNTEYNKEKEYETKKNKQEAIFATSGGGVYMTNKAKPQPYDEDDDDNDNNNNNDNDTEGVNGKNNDDDDEEKSCGC